MVAQHPEHEFVLAVDSQTAQTCAFPAGAKTLVVETSAQQTSTASDGSRTLSDMWRMSRSITNANFDVVLFPTRYTFVPLVDRTPVVLTIHDATDVALPELLFPSRVSRFRWRVKSQLAIGRANRIVTVSQNARQHIARAFGLREETIAVVSEGPHPAFQPRHGDPDVARAVARLHLPPSSPLILAVGGISPHKNLQALVRAAAIVRQREPGYWHVVFVGDYTGDSFLGCYRELVELVGSLDLHDRVTFAGFVPDAELALLYNAATMLVMPSRGEGFGLPALEAMASGLPVAASDSNSLPEVLAGAGLLFDPDSDQAIAECVLRLLREPGLREAQRARGLRRAAAYSWSAGADTMVEVLVQTANVR